MEGELELPRSEHWAAWRARVAASDPAGAEASLRAFVDEAGAWPAERRRKWVETWCRAAFDAHEPLPWPASLAQGLVLPELARGVRAGRRGHARWMAQVPHALDAHRGAAGLPAGGGWREALLEAAIALDPGDDRARRLLVAHLRSEVEWACAGPDGRRAGPQWVADRALRIAALSALLGEPCREDVDRWLGTAAGWASGRLVR